MCQFPPGMYAARDGPQTDKRAAVFSDGFIVAQDVVLDMYFRSHSRPNQPLDNFRTTKTATPSAASATHEQRLVKPATQILSHTIHHPTIPRQ